MFAVKVLNGKIVDEKFSGTKLDDIWTVFGDIEQINLTEQENLLKLLHKKNDISVVINEPENRYVMDVENDYVPTESGDQGGIVVVKSEDHYLELLEYFDVEKDSSFVYKYLRIVRDNETYLAYGKNLLGNEWEFIGSAKMRGEGYVGVRLKGPLLPNYHEFHVKSIKIFRSTKISFLNINPNQVVQVFDEQNTLLDSKVCKDLYSGVLLDVDRPFPCNIYFKLFDKYGNLVYTSEFFECYGGDIYYYGARLITYVNEERLENTSPYFLGHFDSNEILFDIRIENPFDTEFKNLSLTALQYKQEPGFELVKFSTNNGESFNSQVTIPTLLPKSSYTLKGRIDRDLSFTGMTYEPFKFYLKIEQI